MKTEKLIQLIEKGSNLTNLNERGFYFNLLSLSIENEEIIYEHIQLIEMFNISIPTFRKLMKTFIEQDLIDYTRPNGNNRPCKIILK